MPQSGRGIPFRLDRESFNGIIAGKPDEILVSPAFDLEHTRSPLAVMKRDRRARLISKKISGALAPEEDDELEQLALFA